MSRLDVFTFFAGYAQKIAAQPSAQFSRSLQIACPPLVMAGKRATLAALARRFFAALKVQVR